MDPNELSDIEKVQYLCSSLGDVALETIRYEFAGYSI